MTRSLSCWDVLLEVGPCGDTVVAALPVEAGVKTRGGVSGGFGGGVRIGRTITERLAKRLRRGQSIPPSVPGELILRWAEQYARARRL